jgi:hypothetical protein
MMAYAYWPPDGGHDEEYLVLAAHGWLGLFAGTAQHDSGLSLL